MTGSTLEKIARGIGAMYEDWTMPVMKDDYTTRYYVIISVVWWKYWQDHAHLVADSDSVHGKGVYWFDGVEWQHDRKGVGIRNAMLAAIKEAERILNASLDSKLYRHKIKVTPEDMDVHQITSLRKKNSVYSESAKKKHGGGIVCADGVRLDIVDGLITRTPVDPTKDIWFGSIPVASTEVVENINEYDNWETLAKEKFPNWYNAILECGEEKPAFIASIAGSVVYSSLLNIDPLKVVFWAYDADLGDTGKTKHTKLVGKAFGDLKCVGDWSDIVGKHLHVGDLANKYLISCDEAGDGIIRDIAFLKALTSGEAFHRKLYHEIEELNHPVIVMCTANHRPIISPRVATEPLLKRLVCLEWTKQFPSPSEFPCSDKEAHAAIINVGFVVARQCVIAIANGLEGKEGLPFKTTVEEMRDTVGFVPWEEVLGQITQRGGSVDLRTLRMALIRSLNEAGYIYGIPKDVLESDVISPKYLKSCPELRSDRAFMGAIKNRQFEEEGYDLNNRQYHNKFRVSVVPDKVDTTQLIITELDSKARVKGECRYIVNGCSLIKAA